MKKYVFLSALSILSMVATGCGNSGDNQATLGSNSDPLVGNSYAQGTGLGSICVWDYGIGIGGIYSTLAEFQSLIQSKVNSGALTHCVSVNGEMLHLTSPNGLFGPCIGAVSQGVTSYEVWSSCVSHLQ